MVKMLKNTKKIKLYITLSIPKFVRFTISMFQKDYQLRISKIFFAILQSFLSFIFIKKKNKKKKTKKLNKAKTNQGRFF